MNFEDLILENLYEDNESVEINEDIMPITPFLAFASMKKKSFNSLRGKMVDLRTKVEDGLLGKKADALIKKEKARAGLGITTGKGDNATVYKLTKQQMNVMTDVYSKHGKKIANDILEFRKNVLAPYSLIKRKVKEATRITNTDRFGMTKSEFKAYVESGKRKIENRGDRFTDRSEELRGRVDRINEQIDLLKQAEEKMQEGDFPRSILTRLYKEYGVQDKDLLGYSPAELKSANEKMDRDIKDALDKIERIKSGDFDSDDIDEIIAKAKSKDKPKVEEKDDEPKIRKGDFNIALGRYMFRREILNKLKDEDFNQYKSSYLKIVSDMIEALTNAKKDTIRKLRSLNNSMELNDKEKLIWKKRPTASKYSSNLDDFYQAIEEKDFLDAPIYLERSPELKEAEQKIENEIKRFERSLEKKIGKEDFNKLKKYRLINNLITIRELKSTKDLFKDRAELASSTNSSREDLDKSANYISPVDFEKRLWTIHNNSYGNVASLNAAKQEVENLVKQMNRQGDTNVVNKLSSLIEKIRIRRTLTPQKQSYVDARPNQKLTIDDIENKANEISSKNYETNEEKKRDIDRIESMIARYKENEVSADFELSGVKNKLNELGINIE